MYSVKPDKRLALAIGASIAAHLIFGGAILWLIGKALQPAVSERLLVVTFAAAHRDDATTFAAASDAPTARQSEIAPAETANNAGLKNRQAARSQPDSKKPRPDPVTQPQEQKANVSERQPEPASEPPQQPPTETESSQPAADITQAVASAEPAPVITTRSERAVTTAMSVPVKPRRVQMAMTPSQEKMLNKRVRKWAENLHKLASEDGPMRWTHKGQTYEARITRFPARGDTDIEKAMVEVLTEQDGEILRTEMQMKMLAFSHFAQFVHRWDPRVQVHDDTLDGRFHSNSKITLGWDRDVQPRFLGKVTTASREVRYANTRGYRSREDIFAGGLETGVRSIPLVRRYQPPTSSEYLDGSIDGNISSGSDGEPARTIQVNFVDDTNIHFHADGSVVWQDLATGSIEREVISTSTAYLVGAEGKTLYVSGQVNGEVLVYSPTRIVIVDDLTYAQVPQPNQANGPFLGLVSGKNVEIAEATITGPGPLYVHAAIYARSRFRVRDFRKREHSQLYIFGSLTAGSLSATEPRFATHIEFDKRLEDKRPPGYPVTNRFELDNWDGEWTRVRHSAALSK